MKEATILGREERIETPRGYTVKRFAEWQGSPRGVARVDGRYLRMLEDQSVSCNFKRPLVIVDSEEARLAFTVARADSGWLNVAFHKARYKAVRVLWQVPIRASWIAIMLGLAVPHMDTRNHMNPIRRWFWQKEPTLAQVADKLKGAAQ